MCSDLVTKRFSGSEDLVSTKPGHMVMLGYNDSTIPLPPPPHTQWGILLEVRVVNKPF